MNPGTTLTFDLPQGWTLRKVATALARVWLPPFRAVPQGKAAQWTVQPVVEDSGKTGQPLWEPGISTAEYEERLDRAGLSWAIRAQAGRGKGTILARLSAREGQPHTFQLVCSQDVLPETLFDPDKLAEFLGAQGATGANGLFMSLLIGNGFKMTPA